jgi:hypothetical protein
MKKVFITFLVALVSIGLRAQINGAIVGDTNNIKILKVWGTHYERGFAYGSLLGVEITSVFNNYLKPQFGAYYSYARNMVTAGEDLKFDSLFVVEAEAIVDGMDAAGLNTTNMDYVDMLVCNSFLDISKLLSKSMGMGCSSLVSWGTATAGTDLDGKSVISRHLDWTVNTHLINNQIICVSLPSEVDEQPWLAVGFAGMFSVLSGFNQHVGVFQHMMDDFNGGTQHGKQYEPIWFTLRKSIEKLDYNLDGANNVQDVRSAMLDQPDGFADGFLISSIARSTENQDSLIAMIAEVAPAIPYQVFRYSSLPDSIPGDNIYTANYQIARNNAMNFCFRYNAVMANMGDGTNISTTESWELMRDRSHLNHNLQFMQYAPEFDLFRIAVYGNGSPAYQHDPISFSIQALFSDFVGLEETLSSASDITFYPNPVTDALTIMGVSSGKKAVSIRIQDLNGHQLWVETRKESSTRYTLDMKSLPAGIYLIKVHTDKATTSFKVVKK